MLYSTLFLALVSASLTAAVPSNSEHANLLQVREARSLLLQVKAQDDMNDPDDLTVAVTLINKGSAAVKILNDPNSVLSTWKTHTFDFTTAPSASSDGVKAKASDQANVRALKVKYNPKVAAALNDSSAYTILEPGENKTVVHDLSGMYSFRTTGAYTVKLVSTAENFRVVEDDGSVSVVPATVYNGEEAEKWSAMNVGTSATLNRDPKRGLTNAGMANIDSVAGGPPLNRMIKRAASASFTNCTASQQSSINEATKVANTYISGANTYLSGTLSTRYTTWFGAQTTDRLNLVKGHYQKLAAMTVFKFDCRCDDPTVYAYVDPYETTIYPCGAFWNAPVSGTDSKAGTIVHEGSHIQAVGGTEDYVYGQDACKELATSNPDHAVMNADTHEYFAENTPSLK